MQKRSVWQCLSIQVLQSFSNFMPSYTAQYWHNSATQWLYTRCLLCELFRKISVNWGGWSRTIFRFTAPDFFSYPHPKAAIWGIFWRRTFSCASFWPNGLLNKIPGPELDRYCKYPHFPRIRSSKVTAQSWFFLREVKWASRQVVISWD
jgi:hypothetical protein